MTPTEVLSLADYLSTVPSKTTEGNAYEQRDRAIASLRLMAAECQRLQTLNRQANENLTAVQERCTDIALRLRLADSFTVGNYVVRKRLAGRAGWQLDKYDEENERQRTVLAGTLAECFAELKRRGVDVP